MQIIVETFRHAGEPSLAPLRVRPAAGQMYPATMRVECSKSMRASAPPGSRFRIYVQEKQREDGPVFLYSFGGWKWERVV